MNPLRAYVQWLHTGWPAGTVEKLPEVAEDGSTRVPGLYVVGDLTGIPLLKFSAHTGATAVQTLVSRGLEAQTGDGSQESPLDLIVVGAGVSGMAAALEARKAGLSFQVIESAQAFSTIVNFPKGKPIYTYPTDMVPAGDLQFTAQVKEPLVEEIKAQTLGQGIEPRAGRVEQVTRVGDLLEVALGDGEDPLYARRVIVAIGRSGNFRKLGCPGEERDKVSNRLHDPKDYSGQDVLVVGGGDSALETAIALAQCGARVSVSYRKPEFSRPKPDNVEQLKRLAADPSADVAIEQPSSGRVNASTGRFVKESLLGSAPGSLTLFMGSAVEEIGESDVTLKTANGEVKSLPNDAVFAMIGREAPLGFFRRSGVPIRGEIRAAGWAALAVILTLFAVLYGWKGGALFADAAWPKNVPTLVSGLGDGVAAAVKDRTTLVGTLAVSMKSPSFYYTLLYCVVMLTFGIRRIRRRKTPYVTAQTCTLLAVQFIPLFLLPELLLPLAGYNGLFEGGALGSVADGLFPLYTKSDAAWPSWGHPRAYWKAYGLILAWPLNVYNVFTAHPNAAWLAVSGVQTFVIIPLLVWRWGKGAYCGWICSCGGMAETLGDTHRHKMPHGPFWNRLNMIGQVILLIAFVMLILRVVGWVQGDASWIHRQFPTWLEGPKSAPGKFVSYKWIVDTALAGVLGFGLYFHYSGRTWCRFACPLAALMHIYARFSQFRILAEKKKCISCNVCTSVCHQGIDVMNFANKGLPMEDPECVRCSACVQSCPTGVLSFGRVGRDGKVLGEDTLPASPVRMAEHGKPLPVVK